MSPCSCLRSSSARSSRSERVARFLHLRLRAAGKPDQVGAPYGPGGFLFHNGCRNTDDPKCAATDPVRPLDSFVPGCLSVTPQLDIGRMYGLNIIDAHTKPSGSGLDIYWNVSTWNPYAVMLMRTHVDP